MKRFHFDFARFNLVVVFQELEKDCAQINKSITNTVLNDVSQLNLYLESLAEMFVLSEITCAETDDVREKCEMVSRRFLETVANEAFKSSYSNAMRIILNFIKNNNVSPFDMYKSTLPISHIREIVGMFKVWFCTKKEHIITLVLIEFHAQ